MCDGQAIKGVKADLAAEKALNDAISLVVQERHLPDYWTSARQSNTAIIVVDPRTGFRRDQVPDQGAVGAAGGDDLLGTEDDFWIGPRFNGTYNGNVDDEVSSRMYGYDIRFPTSDIRHTWVRAGAFGRQPRQWPQPIHRAGDPVLQQYARSPFTDTPPDGVDGGYDIDNSTPSRASRASFTARVLPEER